MPYADPTEFDLDGRPVEAFRQVLASPPKVRGEFGGALISAFRQENVGVNALQFFGSLIDGDEDTTGYNVFRDEKYRDMAIEFPDRFGRAGSEAAAAHLARKITREQNDRAVLAEAGGMGLVAIGAAVVLDPINLTPIPFITAAARSGVKGARFAARGAKATTSLAKGDDLARMGVRLTRTEASALRQGSVSREAIVAARALPRAERAAVLARAAKISDDEVRVVKRLKEFRGRPPTVGELQEFYVERQVQSIRAGRPIPEVGRSSAGVITTQTDEAEAALSKWVQRTGKKNPTREELKEFYQRDYFEIVGKTGLPPEIELGMKPFKSLNFKTGEPGKGVTTKELLQYWGRRQKSQVDAGLPINRLPAEERLRAAIPIARKADMEATEQAFLASAKSVAPDEKGLRKFFDDVQREQVLGDAPRVKLPAEKRILQDLAAARGTRLAENKAALDAAESIVPIVVTESGKVKKLATAARIERAQRRAMQKIGAVRQALVEQAERAVGRVQVPGAVGRGARAGAAAGGLQGGMEELALFAMQEDRDDALVANTFFAATILGGLFGVVGAKAGQRTTRQVEKMHLRLTEDLTFGDVLARMPDADKVSPAVYRSQGFEKSFDDLMGKMAETSPEGSKLIGEDTFLLGRAMKGLMHLHPTGRLAKSRFESARKAIQKMMPTPYLRQGEGFGPSIMARMRLHSEIGHGMTLRIEDLARATGKHGLSYEEFMMQTARALRDGGRFTGHRIAKDAPAELKEAVRVARSYFDQWEVRLKEVGMIPEAIDLGADGSYLPRVYNFEAIRARRGEFRGILAKHFGSDQADEILDEITKFQGVYDPDAFDFVGTARTGQTKTRALRKIPSGDLEEFLVNDTNFLIHHYSQTVGAQFEYARLFPDEPSIERRLNLRPIREEMEAEAESLARKAKDAGAAKKIYVDLDKALKDLEYVRQTHLGFLNRDPFDAGTRKIASLATGTTAGMYLGNAGFNSMTDAATMFFTNGLGPGFRAAMSKVRHPLSLLRSKYTKNEMARLARQVEYAGIEHTRLQNFFDFTADHGIAPKTFGERGVHASRTAGELAHRGIMVGSGLAYITSLARELNVISGQDAVLRILKKGKGLEDLGKAERNLMKLAGFDDDLMARVSKELQHVDIDDVGNHSAILGKWNASTAEDFQAAILQNSMRGVLNPAKGELAQSFNNPLGRILFMFLSFPLDATNKLLISGAQRMDANVAGGVALMTGVGYFIERMNAEIRGEDVEDEMAIVERGFERAGFPGIVANFWHVMSRSIMREWDPISLLGVETAYERYGGVAGVQDLVPPAAAFEDAMKLMRSTRKLVQGEDITQQEADATVKRAPLLRGNQFYPLTKWISDQIATDPRTFD